MKLAGLFVLSGLCSLSSLRAQTYVTDQCWMKPILPELEATESGDSSSNAVLNQIFNEYQVHTYRKALPFAKNPVLLQIHEIHCDCVIDSLISAIRTSFAEQEIKEFSKFELEDEDVEVYSPEDYFWQLTEQNPDQHLWHLKNTACDDAWDITKGDPNIKLGIIDRPFDVSHPDLATKIFPHFDPHDSFSFTCGNANTHGTQVASCIAAETTEIGDTPQGHLASAGFNCMMVGYRSPLLRSTFLQKALHASAVMGVKTITSCAGGSALSCSPVPVMDEDLIVREILDNGTAIIMPAGNGFLSNGHHCYDDQTETFSPFYPMHPSYDDRIIIVTSTDRYDWHAPQGGNPDGVHARFPEVDLCSPGYGILLANNTDCGANSSPYGNNSGTSFATPIVAGIAGLVYSVNECIAPQDLEHLLKTTTDPVVDAASFPDLIGTGRVNAYNAVVAAQTYGDVAPVSSSTTWSGDRYVKGVVTIQSGATLTITGTVRMAKDARFEVKPNAHLIVDGGTITRSSGCISDRWRGIYVSGNNTASQTQSPALFGKLTVKNGAIIEHVQDGICNYGLTSGGTTDWGSFGGIIQATQSSFLNNRNGPFFGPYSNFILSGGNQYPTNDLSYFDRCEFRTDNNFGSGTPAC